MPLAVSVSTLVSVVGNQKWILENNARIISKFGFVGHGRMRRTSCLGQKARKTHGLLNPATIPRSFAAITGQPGRWAPPFFAASPHKKYQYARTYLAQTVTVRELTPARDGPRQDDMF